MKRKRLTGIVTVAVFVALFLGFATMSDSESEATNGDTVYEIKIAPGLTYVYEPAFPSALNVELTIDSVSDGIVAHISDGVLRVTPANGVVSGTYGLTLKAESGNPSQCVYQHISFTVVEPLIVSGFAEDIVEGTAIDFEPSASSGLTAEIGWRVTDGTALPNGLSLEDGRVTGIPLNVGVQTLCLTAYTEYESEDLVVQFEVFREINGGFSETIVSIGGEACGSTAVPNDSRLGVVWTVADGSLPDSFTLSPDTGEISGYSDDYVYETVELTAVTTNGPLQVATKTVTLCCERILDIEASSYAVATYESADVKKVKLTPSEGTGRIEWSVSEAVGVSVSDGILCVRNTAETGNIIVTASTDFGQNVNVVISVTKEPNAVIHGGTSLEITVGSEACLGFVSNVEGTWSVSGKLPEGVSAEISEYGVLSISGDCVAEFGVTVSLSTEGGQTVSAIVDCRIAAESVYKVGPTNGVAIYVVRSCSPNVCC